METEPLLVDEDPKTQRLEYFLSHSQEARQKFDEGDRFGVIFALIESGLTQAEYEEFLAINPNNWYGEDARNLLSKTILHRGYRGSPMMLHRSPEVIVNRAMLYQKFLAGMQGDSNLASHN